MLPWTYAAVSVLLAAIALVVGLVTVSRIGVRLSDRGSMFWFGCLLGIGLFSVANALWSAYPVLNEVASPADGFAVTGYFVFLATALYYFVPFEEAISKKIALFTAGVAVPLLFLIGLGVEMFRPTGLVEILVFVYPLLDVLLLMIALPILELLSKGTFWKPYLCLFVGLVFLLIADLWSAWGGFYTPTAFTENLWNTLYSWGYIAVALAFQLRRDQFRRALL